MGLFTVLVFLPIASLFLPPVQCGESESCPQSCAREGLPVCAQHPINKSYRTFPNECSLQAEILCTRVRWNFVHSEECTEEENENCPEVGLCPFIYSPVCGYSGSAGFKTYPNRCDLDRQNKCFNRDYEYVHDGECKYEGPVKDCPIVCAQLFSPVCGYSEAVGFKTFPNKCFLEQRNECMYGDYEYVRDGACKYEGPVQDCQVSCNSEYFPVCGYSQTTGFKTFSNQCNLLRQNQCLFGDYKYAYNGECKHKGQVDNCMVICTQIYNPVCAYSLTGGFNTFSNECFLKQLNTCFYGDYVFAHLGQCTNYEIDRRCNDNCPRDYNPVCGLSASKGYKTFSNICVLGVTNRCKNGDYSLAHLDKCTRKEFDGACNHECPLFYIGVCGYSKQKGFKTFPNDCFLDRENSCSLSNYKLAHLRKCTRAEIGTTCNCVCKDTYAPVCGKSPTKGFTTFPSFCNLDNENSCNFADYSFIHNGECFPWELCRNC